MNKCERCERGNFPDNWKRCTMCGKRLDRTLHKCSEIDAVITLTSEYPFCPCCDYKHTND